MIVERAVRRRQRRTMIEEVEEEAIERHDRDSESIAALAHAEHEQYVKLETAFRFARRYKPIQYLVDPILRTGTIFGVTAATGAGKTGLFLSVGLAVASGRNEILGMPVKQGRVVFVSIENPDEARMRLIVSARRLNVTIRYMAGDFIFAEERCSPEALFRTLDEFCHRHGRTISLILIDSLSAMFDGSDLNSGVEAGNFIRRLRPLNKLPGSPAVLLAMHPGKNAGGDELVPVGSGMILNEIDGNLTLKRKPSTGAVQLHHAGKLRALPFDPIEFSFEICDSPHVLDSDDRPIRLPVLLPARADDKPQVLAIADSRPSSPVAILKAIIARPDASQRDWAAAVGCSQAMVGKHLRRLAADGLATAVKGRWSVTEKGAAEASKS